MLCQYNYPFLYNSLRLFPNFTLFAYYFSHWFLQPSGVDLALDQASLIKSHVIHFGFAFNLFKVIANTFALSIILIIQILVGSKPILQCDLKLDIQFPSIKRKVEVVPIPHTQSTHLNTIKLVPTPPRSNLVRLMLVSSFNTIYALFSTIANLISTTYFYSNFCFSYHVICFSTYFYCSSSFPKKGSCFARGCPIISQNI